MQGQLTQHITSKVIYAEESVKIEINRDSILSLKIYQNASESRDDKGVGKVKV